MKTEIHSPASATRDVLLAFVDALNPEDFKTAREYVCDDMKFEGVLGSREGADLYFSDMERMKLKYKVKKVVAEDDDACLLFDVTMRGIPILSSGWYHMKDGKISTIRVIFDPRPLL